MSSANQMAYMNLRSFVSGPAPIGGAYGGGFYAGQIGSGGVATHNLVIGPASSAQFTGAWKTSNTSTTGTDSVIDGPANTAAMIAAGASAHPCGQFCDNLVTGGFSDWYMPATNELSLCYYNLKPTTSTNTTGQGANVNAVPTYPNFTSTVPSQTIATAFRSGGAEAFRLQPTTGGYWSSTQFSSTNGRYIEFSSGTFSSFSKNYSGYFRVRAVRRVPV